jgi:ribose-phosphate pyrophosphokinase
MPDLSQAQIGIIACPGGRAFAQMVFGHLEAITRDKFEERIRALSQAYGLPRAEIIRQVNLASDLLPSAAEGGIEPITEYRSPNWMVPAKFTRFPNGEFKTEILASVRSSDIYVVQDVSNRWPLQFQKSDDPAVLSVNDHLFCLLVTIDAALQAGAAHVTVVLPTYPYSRQHKKLSRESLSAARVGQILENLGVNRLVTLDIHSKEIENSFNHMRLENLHGSYQILKVLATVVDLKDDDEVLSREWYLSADVSNLFARIIWRLHHNRSLGSLLDDRSVIKDLLKRS